jgi:hypothetical protein
MMNRRKLLVGLTMLLILGIATSGVHRVEELTYHYATMPPTDEDLLHWLAAQPGIEKPEVWREADKRRMSIRFGTEPPIEKVEDIDKLRIRYRIRFWRETPVQGIEAQLERLGYRFCHERLVDRTRMSWGW